LLKRFFAILLLSVCLINLAGYGWLFDYLEAKTTNALIQQLDRHEYQEEELIEVKFPFQVPYNNDWPDYRREDGQLEINGKYYSYVKIKISQDTIYLKCLPNQNMNKLAAARQEVNKKLNNLPCDDTENNSIVKKANLLFGFNQKITSYQIESPQINLTREYEIYCIVPMSGYTGEQIHPPIA